MYHFWVDIDNAPHVLVLYPIIKRLEKEGHYVTITARDYGQVIPLLKLYRLEFELIGKHAGKNIIKKIINLLFRSLRLCIYAAGKKFDAVFTHGSRAVFLPAKILHIPQIGLGDYEHTTLPSFIGNWARLYMVPELFTDEVIQKDNWIPLSKYRKYPGLKEHLYIYDTKVDEKILSELNIPSSKIIVLIRPPATMAHYHVDRGEVLFQRVLNYLKSFSHVEMIILPRTKFQKTEIKYYLKMNNIKNATVPEKVYYGPSLIMSSDVVISGGGTMNREAACLGVPVYSIFAGTLGSVDRHLIESGRLILISRSEDIQGIKLEKKSFTSIPSKKEKRDKLVDFLVKGIYSVVKQTR